MPISVAATQTRPVTALPPPAVRSEVAEARLRTGAPVALGAALAIAVLYAAFANGAVGLADESRLQVAVAAIAIPAVAALIFGRGLVARLPRRAWIGLGLLAGFAARGGLSVLWAVAPPPRWGGAHPGDPFPPGGGARAGGRARPARGAR